MVVSVKSVGPKRFLSTGHNREVIKEWLLWRVREAQDQATSLHHSSLSAVLRFLAVSTGTASFQEFSFTVLHSSKASHFVSVGATCYLLDIKRYLGTRMDLTSCPADTCI